MKIKVVKKEEKNVETKKPKLTRRKLMEQQLDELNSLKSNSKTIKDQKEKLEKSIESSKRGSRSKNKGSSYERTIAGKFKAKFNADLVRTPQSGGFAKNISKADEFRGDIVLADKDYDFKLHIECKNSKTWSLPKWIKQAEEDCPKNKIPLVIFHKHGTSKDYVTLSLEDLFSLVRKEDIIIKKGEL